MGGGYYDRDVHSTPAASSSSGGYDYASYSDKAAKAMSSRSMSSDLSPVKRKLSTDAKSPIVVALDVTGSMGDWSKTIYDKMPMFFGQIMLQGYLADPAISFAAVGDANTDSAPLQVCDFARGTDLDDWLKKLYLEGGGGGTTQESYELAAALYAKTTFAAKDAGPIFFFIGDEGFYKTVSASVAKAVLGVNEGISGDDAMKSLTEKFEVFLVHKAYDRGGSDSKIVAQWSSALGAARVLKLDAPKAVVDVMLGALAIVSSARDLDSYVVDMEGRGQTTARIATVKDALGALGAGTAIAKVDTSGLPSAKGGKSNKGKGKKL